ncbi:MAG: type II CAAX endopeptidase family protein [Pseudomonadota bacterium]
MQSPMAQAAPPGTDTQVASKRQALVVIALVLLYMPFSAFVSAPIAPLVLAWGEGMGRVLHELPRWLYLACVLGVLLFWTRTPLSALGMRDFGWRTVAGTVAGVLGTFALALTVKALVAGIPHAPENLAANAAELRWSIGYASWVALRAGVVEEVLYRAVLIEQLAVILGKRWLGAALAGLVFVSAHALAFDWFQLAMAASATVILTLVYMRGRNLPACICAHVLIDMVGFLHLVSSPHPN